MSRLSDAREAIERGESVNWNRVAVLQALDIAVGDEDFVAAAMSRQEESDGRLRERIANAE